MAAHDVVLAQLDTQPVASIVIPGVGRRAVGAALHGALPDVFSHLQAHAVEMAGPPFARFLGQQTDTFDIEIGIPIPASAHVPETDTIKVRSLPAGEAATTVHTGSFDELPQAWSAIEEWVAANGRAPADAHWESYLDDPSTVPAAEVRTALVQPLVPAE